MDDTYSAEFLKYAWWFQEAGRVYGPQSIQACRAFAKVMANAPSALRLEFDNHLKEIGLVPAQAEAYSKDGEPLYRLEDIAQRAGLSEAEARQSVNEFVDEMGDLFPVEPSEVHRTQ